jgi:hypothetical protein
MIALIDTTAETLIKLLEVIIWPGTLLIIILMFRSQFKNAMGRMGSFKADSTGISMTFEPKLDAAKKVFAALKPGGSSKSTPKLQGTVAATGTPREQLDQIASELKTTLVELGEEANLNVAGKPGKELCVELERSGVITHESGTLIATLLEVISAAPATISQSQADEITAMYRAI